MKRLLIAFFIAASVVIVGFLLRLVPMLTGGGSMPVPGPESLPPQPKMVVQKPKPLTAGDGAFEPTPVQTRLLKTHAEIKESDAIDLKDNRGIHFRIDENGLAVADGDIVLGIPKDGLQSGFVAPPPLQLWAGGEIPFAIEEGMSNPERIIQAMSLFAGSGLSFVAVTPQHPDAVAFQISEKDCKSYLGRVGGHQPIWIAPSCSAGDIAHELMHAAGFLHEQNRTDRDAFVRVMTENVLPGYLQNFTIFPASMMGVSGTGPFDYESLMIYPPSSFSKNGEPTLASVRGDRAIRQPTEPSKSDLARIQAVYGGGN